jgi:hypothetical protein
VARLFAEAFSVPLLPSDGTEPELRYDEERALNVLPDGRPFIEVGRAGGTETLTEVRSEADDYDESGHDDEVALTTVTKVASERDDVTRAHLGTQTETRVPGEKDDFARGAFLGTMTETSVSREPDDEDRDARGVEGFFSFGTVTKTSVAGEADDFWSEDDEPPLVGPALLSS